MTAPQEASDGVVGALVRRRSAADPGAPAYVTRSRTTTWGEYDRLADTVCAAVRSAGGPSGEGAPVAVFLPDTAVFHAAIVGCRRAGRVSAMIGARTGDREAAHIMSTAGARVLVTAPTVRGRAWRRVVEGVATRSARPDAVIVVDEDDCSAQVYRHRRGGWAPAVAPADPQPARGLGPSGIALLNSTSGTTGLPKVVAHAEHTWLEFARLAARGGRITEDDVVCSVVPAPYGFGLWTAHFLPALLGVPTVVVEKFDVVETAELIERERVTVLCCVTTQCRMLLRSAEARGHDLSSLRVLYTGGESVGRAAAEEFERVTGARVLQFYGSNEAGPVSATTVDDDADTRLGTCGRLVGPVDARVRGDDGAVSDRGPCRGRLEVRSPMASRGYWNDENADRALFTEDGWVRLGDLVEIDEAGRLTVIGRTAQIVIRGGRNISIAEVEDVVRGDPDVRDAVAVAVPDPVFGERVCAVVVPAEGRAPDTASLGAGLRARGVSPELFPEYVVCVDEVPQGPGGKADRAELARVAAASVDAVPR
ncbi:class I adenylate-forming enzyme family protein [Tomitella gaofuii]|uniref:class I adenylate-forming enzyme family protein n=1 Tax=Tomitella gaofuii TaxID=2760083 RepID=UPI0015F7CD80|nr:class I adenylate-forming enzyme family protein [Tomitella gaofuii]